MKKVVEKEKKLWQLFQEEIKTYGKSQELMVHLEEVHGLETIGSRFYCPNCEIYEYAVYVRLPWYKSYKYLIWMK